MCFRPFFLSNSLYIDMPQMQRLNDWPSSLKRIDSLEAWEDDKREILNWVGNSEGGGESQAEAERGWIAFPRIQQFPIRVLASILV